MSYQLTSLIIGLILALLILWLVRRGHLHGPQAFWWIGLGSAIIFLGTWPELTDLVARHLGVTYPPILAVVLGFGLLFIKLITMDLTRSRQEQRIRRLAQRLAILESRLESLEHSEGWSAADRYAVKDSTNVLHQQRCGEAAHKS